MRSRNGLLLVAHLHDAAYCLEVKKNDALRLHELPLILFKRSERRKSFNDEVAFSLCFALGVQRIEGEPKVSGVRRFFL